MPDARDIAAAGDADPPAAPRCIRLRRPPVLQVTEEPFVPERLSLDRINRRWASLREHMPTLYDGSLYHVWGVHRNGHGGAIVHVSPCPYRFHAVQDEALDLGVRPLGVKGLTICGDEATRRYLLGRRSAAVAHYPGLWEFAPGGVVEPGDDPAETVAAELMEETRLTPRVPPTATAMLYDRVIRTWEIVYRIEPVTAEVQPTAEYDALQWVASVDIDPGSLTPIARQMLDLCG